ncbi:MAG: hypothetical protein JWP03_2095 [Phycisphaerales bacterium]|nr:hypothetical protein [Phycisphaerales bacterium]
MSLGRKHHKPVDDMPKTVSEAVDRLLLSLSEEDKALIRGTEKVDLIRFHRSWGMGIRNGFGLWGTNKTLISALPPESRWADDSSMFIIEQVWERLRGG